MTAKLSAEEVVKELQAEIAKAMAVLKPSMPESGLVDACKQRMQAYIGERDNADEAMRQLEAAQAQVREAEALKAWQSIETAPKDGTEVILSGPMSVDFGSWQDEEPEQRESGVIVDPGLPAGWYGYKGMCPWQEQPTLWQPLPPPPSQREGIER